MMQSSLFEPARAWADGWSQGKIGDAEPGGFFTELVTSYVHHSGAQLATRMLCRDGDLCGWRVCVWLTEDEWCEHFVGSWSHLGHLSQPPTSGEWDRLLEETEPTWPCEECPAVYGQWVFIRELLEALRNRGLA